ncbi:hypothetical protein PV689_29280 [Streptomyces sp. ATCC51928]|uniref:Uncharacterized protein n=1 Tax=Streptomyces caviscabies TaxID=90079 RepID=A0ABW2MNK0_9ACTN|nr:MULTISPECIES: hypothetical protein [unclassified Streptomyces]MDX3506023.1 hypothetical protein [Streptomyces sp. ATCC51928]MDX5521925.1 hypothetical protein [Streptomyces sp. DE06-01C]
MRSRALAHTAALFLSTVLASALLATGGGLAHARTPDAPAIPTTPATPSTGQIGHTGAVPPRPSPPPSSVDGGAWRSGHLQGAAVDRRRGHIYFSFTDLLVKTDLAGRPIGSVTGFTGHLGDLDFNTGDGRVYGSLEYKAAEAFYIAIFDGSRITRMNMDARTTDVVSTVHLREVVRDYTADMNGDGVFDGDTGDTPDHRYGCSGIDGVAFGPDLNRRGGGRLLTVAYGIYSNTARTDNDHQVLLQYDVRDWRRYERPLTEDAQHTSGPGSPDGKFFAHTGNTTYGVQNLEYDGYSGNWLMAVYKGKKTAFPNYSLYVVDGSKPARRGVVKGQPRPESGRLLSLLPRGLFHEPSGVYGYESAGQYGLVSLDDGRFYLGEAGTADSGGTTLQTGRAVLHRWTGAVPDPFTAPGHAR